MNTLNEKQNAGLMFSEYLASLVHDMKNSLGMLLNTTDEILGICSYDNCPSHNHLQRLQYESKRVNNNLMQLLTLYKIDREQLDLNIDCQSVSEFLEDIIMYNKPLLDSKRISIEVNCPPDISWFFDRELVSGVINNVLNNAYRYAKYRIIITVSAEKTGYLSIHIDDDGNGYPENMINSSLELPGKTNFLTGGTGLGLYFANSVIRMHKNKSSTGYISLSNHGIDGGGRFSIFLP